LERAFGRGLSGRDLYDMYDASPHPREGRPSPNLLDRTDAGPYSTPSARPRSRRAKGQTSRGP
jgi:hypothetical protein